MLRKILYVAVLVCAGLLTIAALDVLMERSVPVAPSKRPVSAEERRV